jgi:phospholipase C
MGYFTRDDIPFHHGLADAFTVCDRWFCSVIGPTNPNRLMMMTGTIDPEGLHGGPEVNNIKLSGFTWTTMPEQLQAAGIDWYLYRERDDYQESQLDHFVRFQDPATELYRRSTTIIPDGQLATKVRDDVVSGNLPQVSWIIGPERTTEHPHWSPAVGAHFIASILEALTADPKVWAKTALILTYDENGGFFDHVVPPMAPPGTPGEYLTPQGLANCPEATGIAGPIGLGPRVPAMVISPFSRGGRVCSETFDHTSILRFLEARFGVEAPNLSAWRRETCGDLTSAFSFGAPADLTVPDLPDTAELVAIAAEQCQSYAPPRVPMEQAMPVQPAGTRPRSTGCAVPASAGATSTTTARERITLPATGGRDRSLLAFAAGGAAVGALRLRRRVVD